MKRILNRVIAILPAIVLQVGVWVILYGWFEHLIPLVNLILGLAAFVLVLYIITRRNEATYKTSWLLVILIMPIFGAWLYLYFGNKKTVEPIVKRIKIGNKNINFKFKNKNEVISKLEEDDLRFSQTLERVSNQTGFPITVNNSAKYYSLGEEMLEDMLIELKNAEKFIFIEYFILENGKFWNSILKILEEKVKNGVDVRVLYDDLGSIATYSLKNMKELNKKGIKCIPFNPLIFIKSTLNNRDHRKMMIIDNKVAFSGGINIADEYINEIVKYGHWKDIGFKIMGESVRSYTYMFMEFWNAYSKDKILEEYLDIKEEARESDGYILSYYDSPASVDEISYNLYIDLLYQAKNYIWFYSPYLILGDRLINAIISASKRGVNVKIILPGVPDKKLIYRMAKSHYSELIASGVEIYEYEPGFLHAKALLMDDKVCTIGTVNLDYRSLFLHFENNSLFYKAKIVNDLKKDMLKTLEKSRKIEEKDINKKFFHRLIDGILRIFAPLC